MLNGTCRHRPLCNYHYHRRHFNLVSSLFRPNYLAADHRRDFGFFFIQTELPRRWSSARFWFLLYKDRITSPLIIGEILASSLYRQNYLAADHWRDFGFFFIQTELPGRWSSARFWLLLYADRITSPLIIGEILASFYRQNYLAADHRRDFGFFFTQTELPRRWSSVRFSLLLYTGRITSPLIIGEIFGFCFMQTELPRRWSSARFWFLQVSM